MSGAKWNGIIETVRLPMRCPACAKVGPACEESGGLHRVSCACGWSAKYALVEEVQA